MGEKMGEDGEEEDLKELGGGICEEGIMELRKIQMASKPTGQIFRRPALKGTPMATRDFHQLVSRGRVGEIGETWNLLYSYSPIALHHSYQMTCLHHPQSHTGIREGQRIA